MKRLAAPLGAILARAANAGLAFASTIVITRALEPADYGAYAWAVALLGLLALVTLCGLDSLTPRTLSIYYLEGQTDRARAFNRWTNRVVLAASAIVYGAATAVLAWNPLDWDPERVLAARLVLLGLPFVALLRLTRARYQAVDRTAAGLFYELPFWNAIVLAIGFVALLVPALQTSPWISLLHGLSYGLAYAVARIGLRLPPGDVGASHAHEWIPSARSFALIALVNFFVAQADILLVGSVLGEVDTADFAVAFRSAGLVLLFLQPLQQVVAPSMARAWHKQDAAEVSRLARSAARWSLLVAVPMAAFFWVFGHWFLLLFGAHYVGALPTLRILSLAPLALVLLGPGHLALQMIHRERRSLLVFTGAMLVGVPLTLAMAIQFGPTGAAFAKIAVSLLSGVGALVALRGSGVRVTPL